MDRTDVHTQELIVEISPIVYGPFNKTTNQYLNSYFNAYQNKEPMNSVIFITQWPWDGSFPRTEPFFQKSWTLRSQCLLIRMNNFCFISRNRAIHRVSLLWFVCTIHASPAICIVFVLDVLSLSPNYSQVQPTYNLDLKTGKTQSDTSEVERNGAATVLG